MDTVVVGLCAASGGATVGLLTGAILSSGKVNDLEFAYGQLSNPVRRFLKDHAVTGQEGGILVSQDELVVLWKALDASERMTGCYGYRQG
jgi:hypothetical protein